MGKDFTNNLGLSYEKLINVALFITATITALVVVTVGTLPFLGLVIPNIISIYRGDHLKKCNSSYNDVRCNICTVFRYCR